MYDSEFMHLHSEIQKELKRFVDPSMGLLMSLPNGEDYFKPIKMIAEQAIEGYLFTSIISDEKDDIRDKISKQPDRYDRRKLKLNSLNIDSYLDYWSDLGVGSREIIVLYFTYNETFLKKLFALCSPATLVSGTRIEQMKRKFRKKVDVVGVVVNTCFDDLIFDAYIDIKLDLYDMSQKYGNMEIEDYKRNLVDRGLMYGVPPIPNMENAKKFLEELRK